ncbi:hypothetical protein SB749_18775, partial [Brevibacterium sp. SIMBA_078]|uniref:DarT1-associated NADAR antitoxin family protein n=1 Tax=Brevibacterium sp. SIMBA_078 TaxID=3085816 RepID=UPI00397BC9EB
PKTLFYDWLYLNALSLNEELIKEVIKYDAFTDIEFNPGKSINCQARSVALFVALYKTGELEEALSSEDNFKKIAFKHQLNKENVKKQENEDFKVEQLNIFNLDE